jgi:uncharacterized membrane protein YhaH (DUF805 family)
MDLMQLLFSFNGRISRQPFWLFVLAVFVVQVVLVLLVDPEGSLGVTVLGLFSLLVIWPSLAVQVKRWHDRDKSGWWVLINFVPIIGPLWALIENGFLRGTEGPNRFGEDPLMISSTIDPGSS